MAEPFHSSWSSLRQALPKEISFGTSSWNYPGWKGLVYQRDYPSEKAFTEGALEEYSTLFSTVGVDSFFYSPPRVSTLERYNAQVPDDFRFVSKVWEEITIPRYARHPRYGARAGTVNENFLSAELFKERVLPPYLEAGIVEKLGPFVFQFQRLELKSALDITEFLNSLSSFLGALPTEFQYAIELRNRELLTAEYFQEIGRHGVTHCFNHWTGMPPLIDQMRMAALGGGVTAPFFLARVLTPLGVAYEDAVKRFAPYREIQLPNLQMRNDLVRLILRGLEREIPVYIIVNNRSEGCSPRTIEAVAGMVIQALG